jgi:hypothetical protein
MCKFLAILSAFFGTNNVGDSECFFKHEQCSVMGIEAALRCLSRRYRCRPALARAFECRCDGARFWLFRVLSKVTLEYREKNCGNVTLVSTEVVPRSPSLALGGFRVEMLIGSSRTGLWFFLPCFDGGVKLGTQAASNNRGHAFGIRALRASFCLFWWHHETFKQRSPMQG